MARIIQYQSILTGEWRDLMRLFRRGCMGHKTQATGATVTSIGGAQ